MVGKDKKTQFDMDILGRVDDEEAFKSFDWSTFFYTRLLNSLKTSLQGKKKHTSEEDTKFQSVSYYNIKGYVLAFQVWAYEVLSTANEHTATRKRINPKDIEMELYTSSILQSLRITYSTTKCK
ncbi:hypothetical protein IC575_002907 [Cucumis melo]